VAAIRVVASRVQSVIRMTNADFLTREEELRLFEQYRSSHDRRMEERLLRSQVGLVWQLARSHRAAGVELEDLAQEGMLGLLQAIRRFDPARGVRLSTYASWWIRAYHYRYLVQNHRLVRIGTTQGQRRIFFRIAAVRAQLEAEGLEATPERIAKALDVDAAEVRELEPRLRSREVSIDSPNVGELCASATPADEVASTRELASVVREEHDAFRVGLDARRRKLFDARWLVEEPATLQSVGDELGVTRERARQLEQGMLKGMRERLEARLSA